MASPIVGRWNITGYDTLIDRPGVRRLTGLQALNDMANNTFQNQLFVPSHKMWTPSNTTWSYVDVAVSNGAVTLTFPNGESVLLPQIEGGFLSTTAQNSDITAFFRADCSVMCTGTYEYILGEAGARFVLTKANPFAPATAVLPPAATQQAPVVSPVAEQQPFRGGRSFMPRANAFTLGLYRHVIYQLLVQDPAALALLQARLTPQELELAKRYLKTHLSVAIAAPNAQLFNSVEGRGTVIASDIAEWLRELSKRQARLAPTTGAQVGAPVALSFTPLVLIILLVVAGAAWWMITKK